MSLIFVGHLFLPSRESKPELIYRILIAGLEVTVGSRVLFNHNIPLMFDIKQDYISRIEIQIKTKHPECDPLHRLNC